MAAPTLASVRMALERRDGDSDEQLDEGVVNDLRNDLPIDGPLDVYANLQEVIESNPKLQALAARTPWMQALDQGALSARAIGSELQVELVLRTDSKPVTLAVDTASAAAATCLARSEIWAPDWLSCDMVTLACCTAAACSAVEAACCCVEARISLVAAFRSSDTVADRVATSFKPKAMRSRLPAN